MIQSRISRCAFAAPASHRFRSSPPPSVALFRPSSFSLPGGGNVCRGLRILPPTHMYRPGCGRIQATPAWPVLGRARRRCARICMTRRRHLSSHSFMGQVGGRRRRALQETRHHAKLNFCRASQRPCSPSPANAPGSRGLRCHSGKERKKRRNGSLRGKSFKTRMLKESGPSASVCTYMPVASRLLRQPLNR